MNISSVSGLRYIGKPQVAYSATKAAILSFIQTPAVIYADKRVRVNAVVRGLINTQLVKMWQTSMLKGIMRIIVKLGMPKFR